MSTEDKASRPVAAAQKARVLLLPGWLDSDAGHWQSRWQRRHGYARVVQDDWVWPKRGDWMARLEDTLLAQAAQHTAQHAEHGGATVPLVTYLVAHSLGTQLVAAWAAHSNNTRLVAGALLVAPPDVERADMPPNFFSWCPIVRQRLPFPALAVVSSDDPYCSADAAAAMVSAWGARLMTLGPWGHINGDSGLGDWDEGHTLLATLHPNQPP
jgi:uncharacterized protein